MTLAQSWDDDLHAGSDGAASGFVTRVAPEIRAGWSGRRWKVAGGYGVGVDLLGDAPLAEKLERYLERARVDVIVREVHSPTVVVVGEVARPGEYVLRGPTRLLDILSRAGGVGEFAARREVRVFRRGDGAARSIRVDYARLMGEAEGYDIYLLPGDRVVVP